MAVNYKYLWMLMICGVLVKDADTACYLDPIASKRGVPGAILDGKAVADFAECQAFCDETSGCEAAQVNTAVTPLVCGLLYPAPTAPYEDDASYSLLLKTSCPTAGSCTMTSVSDTMATGTNIQLQLTTAAQCGEVCLFMTECSGVVYSSGSCSLYGGSPAEGNSGVALTHVKEICSGKACCMTATSTMKAENAALKTLTSSLASCEEVCVASSNCHSVYFNNNVCFMYKEAPTTSTSTGSTYSVKSCTGSPAYEFTLTELCYGSGEGKMTQSILLVSVIGLALNAL